MLGAGGGRLVLVAGGPDAARGCASRPTWTFDGAAWTAHSPPSSPPAATAAATDPGGGLLLLTPTGETWRWDGSIWELGEASAPQGAPPAGPWTQRSPAACPAPRTGAAIVTDDAHRVVLLFGGSASPRDTAPPVLGDTWTWDGATWSERRVSPAPPARTGAVAAFDAARSDVVLFGGEGLDDKGAPVGFNATWTWDGSAWKRREAKTAPPAQPLSSMAWDPGGRSVVLVTAAGPAAVETWSWDGTTWTQVHTKTAPPFGALVTAPDLGGLLLVSSSGIFGYGGGDWHRLPVTGTPALPGASVAFEPSAHRALLLSGDAVWAFDGHAWTRLGAGAAPSPRTGAALARDPNGAGLLFFGGTTGVLLLGDTWEFR